VNTRTPKTDPFEFIAEVCPEEANTPRKKLLQRPTSLEIADLPSASEVLSAKFHEKLSQFRVPQLRPRGLLGMWSFPAKVVTEAESHRVGYILSLRIHGIAEARFEKCVAGF
jgi:hypothetical protein